MRKTTSGCLLLVALTGLLLFCTPLAADSSMVNGLVTGKVCWFRFMLPLFAASVLCLVFARYTIRYVFRWTDVFLIAAGLFTLYTYNWEVSPQSERMYFVALLAIMWFVWRIVFSVYPPSQMFFLVVLMATGLIEAVWGAGQLIGLSKANHALFPLTGSFFNPGPYSGYLAVVLPVSLAMMLRQNGKGGWGKVWKWLYTFSLVCVVAIAVVLPAGMSRSAWIAALFSCAWVYWVRRIGWDRTKRVAKKYWGRTLLASVAGCIVLAALVGGMYLMKKDSADGRLFMWKMTAYAIADQSLKGVGVGGFPVAYAKTQTDYFEAGKATQHELDTATCPNYAFNEYLHIALEQGVAGLALFLLWVGSAVYVGLRHRQVEAVGGLLSLGIFSFSSYPLQLPSFWFVLIFLGAVAVSKRKGEDRSPIRQVSRWSMAFCLFLLLGSSATLAWMFRADRANYREWNRVKGLYESGAYQAAVDGYEKLHDYFENNASFLFDEAVCQLKTDRAYLACRNLEKAMYYISDPMVYYMLGKSEHLSGYYRTAESDLLYSIQLAPNRIYPYYLLTQLYTSPRFFNWHKFRQAGEVVLTRKPKVENTAIREMREEVRKLMEKDYSQFVVIQSDREPEYRDFYD